jgi:RNA polymerase sigma-70 factor (ECF subfamily)
MPLEHLEPRGDSVPANPVEFITTHWSAVLKAGETESAETPAALERLCRTYWYPLHAFVRRSGYDPETAKDLTQSFFERRTLGSLSSEGSSRLENVAATAAAKQLTKTKIQVQALRCLGGKAK